MERAQGFLQLGFFGGPRKENFTPSKKNLHPPKNKMKKNISCANSIVMFTDFEQNVNFKQLLYSFWIVLETISKEQVGVSARLTPRCLQNIFNASKKVEF